MFDLRANYTVKVGGRVRDKEDMDPSDRTFFLCVTKEKFLELLSEYPKSKSVLQKRALERRKVIIDHLVKMEEFNEKKHQKHQKIVHKRAKFNA